MNFFNPLKKFIICLKFKHFLFICLQPATSNLQPITGNQQSVTCNL